MPPFTPGAVVFDLDGLLVDSEQVWAAAERQVVEALGGRWDPLIRPLLLGKGAVDAAAVLAGAIGGVSAARVAEEVDAAVAARFRLGLPPREGVVDLLSALDGRAPLAVATNSRRELAAVALESSGLRGAFAAVVCAEDVVAPKPAPDPYRLACDSLGADPASAVGLEDSPVGVASAKAAGLWVIGCPSVTGTPLSEADVTVASLTALEPAAWFSSPTDRRRRAAAATVPGRPAL